MTKAIILLVGAYIVVALLLVPVMAGPTVHHYVCPECGATV